MGARLSDYESVAPPNSFLHVDNFSGPEELSDFLRHLDQNPATYNSYFQVLSDKIQQNDMHNS